MSNLVNQPSLLVSPVHGPKMGVFYPLLSTFQAPDKQLESFKIQQGLLRRALVRTVTMTFSSAHEME